jgi:putative inorganic carbon (HCO3(-)) transporter
MTAQAAVRDVVVGVRRAPLQSAAIGVCAVLVLAAAVTSGLGTTSADKRWVVLPIAAAVGCVLAALAMTRYAAFVLLILGTRASLDLFKLSGSSAGNTATNSAAARGLDPSSILSVLFLAASVVWLLAQYSSGRRLRGTPLRLALLAFVAAGAISVIAASPPQAAALEVLRILSVAMMFLILELLITSRQMLVKVLYTAYASMLFPLGYTLYGLVLGSPASEVKGSFTRITGPFSQSTTFARYLAFMVVMGVALWPALTRRQRYLMGPTLALSAAFMLMTLTRGPLIAAFAGLLVIAVVQRRGALLLGFVVMILGAAVLVPGLAARFATLAEGGQVAGGAETGNTLLWRLNYWTKVLPLANSNPVTGIGLNMTQYYTSQAKQPHNDFIRAYVETGIVGLAAYLSVLWCLMSNSVRALKRSALGTFEHAVAAGALGCVVCFLVGSMGANVMSNVVSLWYLAAFAAAASYVLRRDPASGLVRDERVPGLASRESAPGGVLR